MKVDITDVMAALQEVGIPPEAMKQVSKSLQSIKDEGGEQAGPPAKYEPLVVCTDPQMDLSNVHLFLLEHNADMNHQEALSEFIRCIADHNVNAKKNRVIKTLGNAFLFLTGKQLKQFGFKIRHKEPLMTVSHKNQVEGADEAQQEAE